MTQTDALQAHPDLAKAYATLEAGAQHFKSSIPDSAGAQRAALGLVRAHVQAQLNKGEIHNFKAAPTPEPVLPARVPSRGI